MNRFRILAIACALGSATFAGAQQTAPTPAPAPQPSAVATAPVDRHLAVLSEKLELSADQQEKVRPILQRMHDGSEAVSNDQTLSTDERQERIHAQMMEADRQMRAVLTDEQKKKLDELEKQMHGGQRPS